MVRVAAMLAGLAAGIAGLAWVLAAHDRAVEACDCGFFDDPATMVGAADVIVIGVAVESQAVTTQRDGRDGPEEGEEPGWGFEVQEVVRGPVDGSLVVTDLPPGVHRGERYFLALVKDSRDVAGQAYGPVGLPSVARIEDGGRLTWLVTSLYRGDLRSRGLAAGSGGAAPAFELRLDELVALAAMGP